MTHFRPEPSGSPGTSTLLTTTISGARAAPRPCPRPPAAATCRWAAPAGTAQPPSAGRAASAAQHPLPPCRRAAPRDPEGERRGAGSEQPAEARRRAGLACLRLALGRGLLSFRLGRGLACPRLAPRPPPPSLQARSAALPTSSQARSPATAPQPPRLRRCSRGALLRFSSGVAAGAGR